MRRSTIATATATLCLAGVLVPAGPAAATPIPMTCPGAIGSEIFIGDAGAFPGGSPDGGIMRIDGWTGARTAVSENANPGGGAPIETPMGMAFELTGYLVTTEAWQTLTQPAQPGVTRIDPVGGVRTTVSGNGAPTMKPRFVAPYGLAVEASGMILVTDAGSGPGSSGQLLRVDPRTGSRTVLSTNSSPSGGPQFSYPADVAVAPNGTIVVVDIDATGGRVIAVHPITGTRRLISSNAAPAGPPYLATPWGVTIGPAGDILVSDPSLGGLAPQIVRVNPANGQRSVISPGGVPGYGSPMLGPGDLVYHCGMLVVTDPGTQTVLQVHPYTGARNVLADNSDPTEPALAWPWGVAARPIYP
jgi:hypothetical protein